MDVRQSWALLFSSGLALAVMNGALLAQEPATPKKRSAPLIYIPKTTVDLSRRQIKRPGPMNYSPADRQSAGVIVRPENQTNAGSPNVSYQRPAEKYAQHEAAAYQQFAVVPQPTLSTGANSLIAASRAASQKAPFIADRGPLRPATAIGRPLGPTSPSLAYPSSSIATQGKPQERPNLEFVVPPVPPAAPLVTPTPVRPVLLDGAQPVAQADHQARVGELAHAGRRTIRVTHTITTLPAAQPIADIRPLPTATAPRPLTVAAVVSSKPVPIAEPSVSSDITPTRQVAARHATVTQATESRTAPQISSPGSLTDLMLVSFPDDERDSLVTTVQHVVPVLPEVTLPTPPAPPESSKPKSSTPPQTATSSTLPSDVLLSELEREVAEMHVVREQLRNTMKATEQQAREATARADAQQAAQLQTLVTQVITKVRADRQGNRTATSDPQQRTQVVSAENLPTDFITIGSRLYARGMFEDAEVAFRTARDQAGDDRDRVFATYLLATSLRRQSELTEAARYYRDVAAQSDEPELRDLARWQLKNVTAKRTN